MHHTCITDALVLPVGAGKPGSIPNDESADNHPIVVFDPEGIGGNLDVGNSPGVEEEAAEH